MLIGVPHTKADIQKDFRSIRRWELFLAITCIPATILALFTFAFPTDWQTILPWFASQKTEAGCQLVLTLWGFALAITFFRRIGWQMLGARF